MKEATKQKLSKIKLEYYKKNPHPKGKDAPTYKQINFICEYCGAESTQHPSIFNRSKHHFCSRECNDKWKIGDNHPNKKSDYIEFVCSYCEKESKQKRCNYANNSVNHFCSRQCSYDYVSENRRGENCYNWKNGATGLRDSIRGCRDYRNWRTAVFQKNKYTCVECGQIGGYLEAHHITSFVDILNEYNIATLEDAYKVPILWDIDNGITLCRGCHLSLHKNNK